MVTYRTHYKPNPCNSTGFNSKFTDDIKKVDCRFCLNKNLKEI